MAVQPRGKITMDIEECEGCRLCCLLSVAIFGAGAGNKQRWSPPGVRQWTHLHRVRHLLLLLPVAGRNHRLRHEGEGHASALDQPPGFAWKWRYAPQPLLHARRDFSVL